MKSRIDKIHHRPAKRCEPCRHKKRRCNVCSRDICLNDFRVSTIRGVKRIIYCKDCANNYEHERKKRIKAGRPIKKVSNWTDEAENLLRNYCEHRKEAKAVLKALLKITGRQTIMRRAQKMRDKS
jgi:hypothetical protein